ncbi:MAG: LuxR C-terminal-related transcriptional regulator [Flavobacteriaceae bacterium]
MKKTIITFSIISISLLGLFQMSKYSITRGSITIETTIAVIAVVFLLIGMWLNRKTLKEELHDVKINSERITSLGISEREYQILQKISEGYSNKEIGDQLYVSESTIKTHVSNLFQKLDVKRRTQAVQKAKDLNIL